MVILRYPYRQSYNRKLEITLKILTLLKSVENLFDNFSNSSNGTVDHVEITLWKMRELPFTYTFCT